MIKKYFVPLGLGLLGMFVMLLAWHVWQDHQFLHTIRIVQQAAPGGS